MGFAELKALVAKANKEVEEGQAVIAVGKDKLDDALNVATNAVNDVRSALMEGQEKYDSASAQYAGISDNDSIQAAAVSASDGREKLSAAVTTVDNALKDLLAALKQTEETADEANKTGEEAKAHADTYTSRF